ncbi:prephenate dehydratase family protein [Micavibrio aeruginosavorus ARL-13]|uniref:prephenate dehydratase n=2 Tax=Micavibrio aeruginosavorus TaxID=349221 RepID=G2KPV1_MICAA|nr:prephenate dehydratase family protein [Micavibrio aeruginosavorus ARL-13]
MGDTENKPMRVSYQGIKGSFSYRACSEYFPDGYYQGYRGFQDALSAVENGDVDFAMIPVENSTSGRVMEVYNLLPESGLFIVGEHMVPIHHCLMIPRKAFRGAPPENMTTKDIVAWKESDLSAEEVAVALSSIREVRSHPQALSQCRKFMADNLPRASAKEYYDTAGAARAIANFMSPDIAAIASEDAADLYNMTILQKNIEDVDMNTTRFLVLAREPLAAGALSGPAISSILFETAHKPGALFRVLNVFERHNIDMTKLETYMAGPARPNPTFYVDVGANMADPAMKPVLDEFAGHTAAMRIMGCYPASDLRGHGNPFLPVAA